ncbi:hypothetical protein ACFSL4_09465 [Streptomyces caeni]|uniref:DUF5642 domain-containing protein n=1 Tax=Streptomyces caeni TaxID=2307231 RepID=A0ABW4IPC1_9ACTN
MNKSAAVRGALAITGAVCTLIAMTGCRSHSGGSGGRAGGLPTTSAGARADGSAKGVGAGFSANGLQKALLTEFGEAKVVYGPRAGAMSSLAPTGSADTAGVEVKTDKPQCLRLTQGIDADTAGSAPAALVSLADIPDVTVAEVLVAPDSGAADKIMAGGPPADCSSYTTTVDGYVTEYHLKNLDLPDVGDEARGYEIVGRSKKYGTTTSNFVIVFRDGGWMGSLSVTGPKADRATFDKVVQAAHAKAKSELG